MFNFICLFELFNAVKTDKNNIAPYRIFFII